MPDKKQHLVDMVAALVADNGDAAQTAFQQYMVKKTHEFINPQPVEDDQVVSDTTKSTK